MSTEKTHRKDISTDASLDVAICACFQIGLQCWSTEVREVEGF